MMNSGSNIQSKTNPKLVKNSKKQGQVSNTSRMPSIHDYDLKHSEYLECFFTSTIQKIIRRISNNKNLERIFHGQPIFRLLNDCVQILTLSLIELLVFSLYLDKLTDDFIDLPADVFLLYLGLAAKKTFSQNLSYIIDYLKTKIANFENSYSDWENNKFVSFEISIKDINKAFRKLSFIKVDGDINYNFYVDEILQASPPYQIESKEVMKQIMNDDDTSAILTASSSRETYESINTVERRNHNDEVKLNKLYKRIGILCMNNAHDYSAEIKLMDQIPGQPKDLWLLNISKFK
ncbi:hypothetical protein SteCoe_1593 [Stentor coeruleus]|uniref:Uncharacterized protein n=1 Tax=Stentor coeruleus TaxID=5963 RepID=A0A1R2D1B2_9CILI|nr:hypothetical protein SteCoe_1593 [Stentor coeruleus]